MEHLPDSKEDEEMEAYQKQDRISVGGEVPTYHDLEQ
jgi:hypothetical protein